MQRKLAVAALLVIAGSIAWAASRAAPPRPVAQAPPPSWPDILQDPGGVASALAIQEQSDITLTAPSQTPIDLTLMSSVWAGDGWIPAAGAAITVEVVVLPRQPGVCCGGTPTQPPDPIQTVSDVVGQAMPGVLHHGVGPVELAGLPAGPYDLLVGLYVGELGLLHQHRVPLDVN